MLTNKLCYLFSNQSVILLSYRNTKLFFFGMDRVCGIRKIASQDGLMLDYRQQVTYKIFRNQVGYQSRQNTSSKWIWVWHRLHFSTHTSYTNLQLCGRWNRLPLHPSYQRLETQLTPLWCTARPQQVIDRWKAWKRTSADLEKKLWYSSSITRIKRWKTS